jgi:hypothetical protein
MLPLMIAVLTSFIISQGLSMSIYDVMLSIKDLPYLPSLRSNELYHKRAIDVMSAQYEHLSMECTLRDIALVVEHSQQTTKVPVIDEDFNLFGQVAIANLKKYLRKRHSEALSGFDQHARDMVEAYFYRLAEISGTSYYGRKVNNRRRMSIFVSKNIDNGYLRNLYIEGTDDPQVMEFWG